MSGRYVHLLGAAVIVAAASVFSAGTAFANCFSCGGPSVIYQAPVVTYSAPVAYGYTYEAPIAYPAPTQYYPGCGCAGQAPLYQAPMYVVNQGPAYNAPVVGEAEPIPAYEPGYRRAYPYYAGGHVRWHHRSWYRGYGYRGYGARFGYRDYRGYRDYGYRAHGYRDYGYRGYGYRGYAPRGFSYRGFGYRQGAVMPGARFAMRHPMIGRGEMNRMHGMHHPMMGGMRPMMGGMRQPMMGGMMHRGPQHAGGMRPGSAHPMPMPAPKRKMP